MKQLKKFLRVSFEPPKSNRKVEFLRNLNYPKVRNYEFIGYQIGYIRKRIWALSTLFFTCILFYLRMKEASNLTSIWFVFSFTPLIALAVITEIARSTSYHMAELEMTTRFNLQDVLLARMGILGTGNLLLFLLIISLLSKYLEISFLRIGLYLFVPYLLTCYGSLLVLNKISFKDNLYGCAGVSLGISILTMIINLTKQFIYEERYLSLWIGTFIFLIILIVIQGLKYLRNMEELNGAYY